MSRTTIPACRSLEHVVSRRSLLHTMGGVIGLGGLNGAVGPGLGLCGGLAASPAIAEAVKTGGKRVLVIFLHGGVSQLESWDPKPGTDTGGPFRAIPTSVPGVHISELLPHTARQMHRLSIIRSLDTRNGDHGRGQREMTSGRDQPAPLDYPHLGAVVAKTATPPGFSLPGHILVRGGGGGAGPAAYLGPRYAGVVMDNGEPPAHTARPESLTMEADQRRSLLRAKVNDRFAGRRRTAETDAYTQSYEQALDLLTQRHVFDVSLESQRDQDRYGPHEFGRHCLLARRLLEHGVPFVQVNHSNYDTHYENFDFHIEQLGEFDHPFATLMEDLTTRGLLEDTLVCVMSEFGRTPRINDRYGRDHWGTAWSVVLGGAGIQPGAIIGRTNANGTAVEDRKVDHGHVFHTILRAIGVNSSGDFDVAGRSHPIADPAKGPIDELLT
ncbi:MAG: DUF1501 domain-containing protein [Planctomycetota bacterium]|nr:DUF1501 domain-containing protein [Planctomycetota bacterium]